jgi:hypothetical protein
MGAACNASDARNSAMVLVGSAADRRCHRCWAFTWPVRLGFDRRRARRVDLGYHRADGHHRTGLSRKPENIGELLIWPLIWNRPARKADAVPA